MGSLRRCRGPRPQRAPRRRLRQPTGAPDPRVRHDTALAWCAWEDAHVAVALRQDERAGRGLVDADPAFRYGLARLVTHYWRHDGFLPEGILIAGAQRLGGIPAVLIHGTRDISGPPDTAHDLAAAWPGSRLELCDATHVGPAVVTAVRRAVAALA